MELKEAIKNLEKSSTFCEWKGSNKQANLSYAMCMLEKGEKNKWMVGYYSKNSDKTTTFNVADKISIGHEEEIFKKEDTAMKELNASKIKLSLKDAMHKAEEFQKEKYPREIIQKKIAIAQHLQKEGDIWNITFITKSLNVINMKIGAETGKVLSSDCESVLSYKSE